MKFLLYLLLGYSVWEIDTGDLRALLNFCNRSGVRLRRIREGETTVRVWVLLADEAKLMDFAARRGCDLRICVRHGMPILWRRYRHRVGMWAGLLLFFAAIYTAPLFVWEINVEGLDRLSREYVCELLADEGVRIGAFSPAIDRSRVYLNVLRRAAEERGIRLAMLSDYYQSPREAPQHVLVVNYTGIDTEKLPTALARLAELWPS